MWELFVREEENVKPLPPPLFLLISAFLHLFYGLLLIFPLSTAFSTRVKMLLSSVDYWSLTTDRIYQYINVIIVIMMKNLCWSPSKWTYSNLLPFCPFTACPPGSYKMSSRQQECFPCPANSVADEDGSVVCVCKEDHFRTPLDTPSAPCTSNPLVLLSKVWCHV